MMMKKFEWRKVALKILEFGEVFVAKNTCQIGLGHSVQGIFIYGPKYGLRSLNTKTLLKTDLAPKISCCNKYASLLANCSETTKPNIIFSIIGFSMTQKMINHFGINQKSKLNIFLRFLFESYFQI